MTWLHTTESQRWRIAPDFCLPSDHGLDLSLSSFWYRSNIVIVFGGQNTDLRRSEAWARLARLNEEIQAGDGKLIVILASPQAIQAGIPGLEGKPFPVLYDPAGSVRKKYEAVLPGSGNGGMLLIVLDRYGAIFSAYHNQDLTAPLPEAEVVDWLNFIELQCPE